MAKKTYTVKTAVEHDNERFEPGTPIVLDEEVAEALVTANAIEVDGNAHANTDAPTDPQERLAAIAQAIGQLDPDDTDLWLKDGKPDTNAITEVTGWTVTAAERNAVWGQINGGAK